MLMLAKMLTSNRYSRLPHPSDGSNATLLASSPRLCNEFELAARRLTLYLFSSLTSLDLRDNEICGADLERVSEALLVCTLACLCECIAPKANRPCVAGADLRDNVADVHYSGSSFGLMLLVCTVTGAA